MEFIFAWSAQSWQVLVSQAQELTAYQVLEENVGKQVLWQSVLQSHTVTLAFCTLDLVCPLQLNWTCVHPG